MQAVVRRGRPPLGHPVSRWVKGAEVGERCGRGKVSWEQAAEMAREEGGGVAGSRGPQGCGLQLTERSAWLGVGAQLRSAARGKHVSTPAIRASIRPSVRPASPLSVPPSTERPHTPLVPGNHPGDKSPLLPTQRLESGLNPGHVRKRGGVAPAVARVAIWPPEAQAPAPRPSARVISWPLTSQLKGGISEARSRAASEALPSSLSLALRCRQNTLDRKPVCPLSDRKQIT